jgi:hypothetical protein
MLKAVLHALASSESTEIPFLVTMILPVWEGTPWNSAAIRGHTNMSTLAHPDPSRTHALCTRAETIRQGNSCHIPNQMTGGAGPHRQHQGTGGIPRTSTDPNTPSPRHPSYLPSHAQADKLLPDNTLHRGPLRMGTSPTHPHGDPSPHARQPKLRR